MSLQALPLKAPLSQGNYFSIALGYGCAVLIATVIDRYFPDFEGHHRAISNATILIPILVGVPLVALACGVHFTVVALLTSLETGLVVGTKIARYYFDKRDQNICNDLELIKTFRVKTSLKTLDLTFQKLTDEKLQKMVDDGTFKDIECLILCKNPLITAKGLLEYVGKRCPQLVWLDIGLNHQFTGHHLKEWVSTKGFTNLKVLELKDTNLTKKDLEHMIAQPWVQNLEGLNLLGNEALHFPPDNLSRLTKLKGHLSQESGHSGTLIPYDGIGIFIDGYFNERVQKTPEIINLIQAGKIRTPHV